MADSINFSPSQSPAATGFLSPADDYLERKLDLNQRLINNHQATFFLRAHGNSMMGAGIHDGDLLIVDRSLKATHKKIVIASVHGELLVKRLLYSDKKTFLVAENPDYAPIEVTEDVGFEIWGVVTHAIHEV